MLCLHCNQENPIGARFCNSCAAELGAPDSQTPAETAADITLSPDFVGRQREMGELVSALDDALAGRGRLVMLAGEPGIGKTRIAQEFASHSETRGAQVLWGRCYEGDGAPPYWPWVHAIRAYVRERDPEILCSEMGAGAADIAEIVSDLRERLPGLTPPPSLELDPEGARFRLFDSVTTFLKSAGQRQPLVIVLDDLHWADRPSLLLLEFVARELGGARLLVIGTYRDVAVSRRHPLSQTLGELNRESASGGFQRVLLRGLSEKDVERFIETVSASTLPRGLTEAVCQQTEGNPLFVTEVVRLLVQDGELAPERARDRESWAIRIPEGVREVIGRRLSRLSERCNETLSIASVIGREFSLEQLNRLIDDASEERLLQELEEALAAGVVEEVPGTVDRYQFTHGLIQETLAEELSTTRRVWLHARIAEVLEELYGTNAEASAAELAHHFAEAATVLGTEKLVAYSLAAGERALAAYAHEEAVAYFQRALAAKEQARSTSPGQAIDAETAALLVGLGRAYAALLQVQDAHASLTRAFGYYERSGDVARAVEVALCPVDEFNLGVSELVVRALDLVSSDSLEAGRLLSAYGVILNRELGDYEGAKKALRQALCIARREEDVVLEMWTLGRVGSVGMGHLLWDECVEKSGQAIELNMIIDDPVADAWCRYCVASTHIGRGELKEAQSHVNAMLLSAERVRYQRPLGQALLQNAKLSSLKGDWESAREFSDRGLAVARNTALPRFLGIQTLFEYEVGDFDEGEARLQQLLNLMPSRPTDARDFRFTAAVMVIPVVNRILEVASNLDTAEAAAQAILSMPSLTPLASFEINTGLGLLAVQRNDIPAAEELYRCLEPQRGMVHLPLPTCISMDRLLGLLSITLDRWELAPAHFEDALSFCRKAGYRPELAWSCHDYADALLKRNDPGDHEKAILLLEESLSVSTELGMRPLKERVIVLKEKAESQPAEAPGHLDGLTEREVEVLRLIASGKTDQKIADELVISRRTVNNHVRSIFNKTAVANRAEAAAYAARQGLL